MGQSATAERLAEIPVAGKQENARPGLGFSETGRHRPIPVRLSGTCTGRCGAFYFFGFGGAAPAIFWLGAAAFCLGGAGFLALPLLSFIVRSP